MWPACLTRLYILAQKSRWCHIPQKSKFLFSQLDKYSWLCFLFVSVRMLRSGLKSKLHLCTWTSHITDQLPLARSALITWFDPCSCMSHLHYRMYHLVFCYSTIAVRFIVESKVLQWNHYMHIWFYIVRCWNFWDYLCTRFIGNFPCTILMMSYLAYLLIVFIFVIAFIYLK